MDDPGCAPPEIRYVVRVDSTNEELMRDALGVSPRTPHALWAGEQTAGRGRRGRRWVSSPDDSATFSVAIEREVGANAPGLTGLSLAVGVALVEALVPFGCDVTLKWPNDLWRDRRKVGGVLIEARRDRALERIVIGVGLNLVAPDVPDVPDASGTGLGGAAASLLHPVTPGGLFDEPVPRERAGEIVAACARAIVEAFAVFGGQGFPGFRERWVRLDALQGTRVELHDGASLLATGVAAGVGDSGELRLRTAEGTRLFMIGDVSLRPAPPAS